jgi:hypothetical protein
VWWFGLCNLHGSTPSQSWQFVRNEKKKTISKWFYWIISAASQSRSVKGWALIAERMVIVK